MQTFKNNINTLPKKLTIGLAILLLFLFVIYGYFVNATIVNVVEREALEAKAGELAVSVGALEQEYGILKSKITYEYARSLGYYEPSHQAFAQEKRLVGNISIQ